MNGNNLCESALGVNAAVHHYNFSDALRVDKKDPPPPQPWKSWLQLMFARRVKEEMEARGFSGNEMAKQAKNHGHKLIQSTVSRVLVAKQDPGLQKVEAIAAALNLPAWYLQKDPTEAERIVFGPPAGPKRVVAVTFDTYPSNVQAPSAAQRTKVRVTRTKKGKKKPHK